VEEQHETEIHLKDYLRVLHKRRWVILTTFVVIFTLTAILTFRQRPLYQATAQLLIEKENPNILSFKEVMELDAATSDYYQTQYKMLQSRTLAQAVIDRLRLAEHPEFSSPPKKGAPAAADAGEARATARVNAFLQRVAIEPLRNTRLVNIGVKSYDPKLAALMANTLADLYIEQNLKHKVDTTQQAGNWLSEQAAAAKKKLDDAERALQTYNEKNNIISLEERQSLVVQKLEELNSELTKARTTRIELETRAQQLKDLQRSGAGIDAMESMPQVIGNVVIQGMRTDLAKLEGDLAEQSKVYTPKHPRIISLSSQIQTLRQKIAEEIGRVGQSIRNEYEVAVKRERSLNAALEEQKQQVQDLNQKSIAYGALKREVETNNRIFGVLMAREKETGLEGGLRTNNIRIVDRAEVPMGPVSPKKARNLGLGLIIGLIGGVGLAFFLEYLDDTVKDPDDIERHLKVPFLGPVPVLAPKVVGDRSRDLISFQEPKSIYAEAYRAVRTSILFSSPDAPPKSFVVTSPGPQEGKSVTAINLAVTMALTGNRVLLVDADMRKPRLHRTFNLDNSFGLSNLVGGESEVGLALKKTAVPTLMVMTSGPIPPNPSELLGSARMGKLLQLLQSKFDRVVLDCTPLIAVTDATVLSSRADGVILVIKAGATGRNILKRGKRQLEDVQAKIIGAVLNQVDQSKSTYYYSPYYYAHYYGEEKESRKAAKGARRANARA
jgi:capsular exopolysaccharide synthesis family protein